MYAVNVESSQSYAIACLGYVCHGMLCQFLYAYLYTCNFFVNIFVCSN